MLSTASCPVAMRVYTKHVDAKHAIQRWFVEETRLGIPVDFTNEGIRGLCHDRATYFPAYCAIAVRLFNSPYSSCLLYTSRCV